MIRADFRLATHKRTIQIWLCSAIAFFGIALDASPSFAVKKLYWEAGGGLNNTIFRSDLDGSNVEVILTSNADANGNSINYITHSAERGRLYFTTASRPALYSADYDGNNVELMQSFPDSSYPRGIDVNEVTDRLYWPSNHGSQSATNSKIRSVGLDNVGLVDVTSLSDGSYPYGMAIDELRGKMYWSEHAFQQIVGANLDGSSREIILSNVDAYSLALDPASGKLYWPDPTAQALRRANTDGSGVQSIGPLHRHSSDSAVTLDVAAGLVYWSDLAEFSIHRANLDGSDFITIHNDVTYVQSLAVIDINEVPEPSSVFLFAAALIVSGWYANHCHRATRRISRSA